MRTQKRKLKTEDERRREWLASYRQGYLAGSRFGRKPPDSSPAELAGYMAGKAEQKHPTFATDNIVDLPQRKAGKG